MFVVSEFLKKKFFRANSTENLAFSNGELSCKFEWIKVCNARRISASRSPECRKHRSFFSSRRRHTRCLNDWSSDVCSSDLAAVVVLQGHEGFSSPSHPDMPEGWFQRQEPLREARRALGPDQAQAAEDRGTVMSLATAAEYALMLTAAGPPPPTAAPGAEGLSPRERELVTLVAQGHTDAQIAGQLFISVRTVSSHLDRIRDKTGFRRRADLTRLALSAGMV